MSVIKQSLSLVLSFYLLLASLPEASADQTNQGTAAPVVAAPQSPAQLQQLVAPIALYPDALVAQILAAATYPDQVVEADRWLQQHPDLKGEQLGQEVDKQPWDPSVKALTAVPQVLQMMSAKLDWTQKLATSGVQLTFRCGTRTATATIDTATSPAVTFAATAWSVGSDSQSWRPTPS